MVEKKSAEDQGTPQGKPKSHRGKPIYMALTEMHANKEQKNITSRAKRDEAEKLKLQQEAASTKLKASNAMNNKKLTKEFQKVLQNMEHHEEDFKAEDPSQLISFSQMGGILTTLGFISNDL